MGKHIGRHWPNEYRAEARGANSHPTIEADCPCPREECGCIDVDKVSRECTQHFTDKTMRTMHEAEECPGRSVET
jgi:hypothetical protein